MRATIVTLALLVASSGLAQQIRRVDVGADLADWHMKDLDGDGRHDFIFFPRDGDGHVTTVIVARQLEDGSFEKTKPVALPKDTVALALGGFTGSEKRDLALIDPKGVTLFTLVDGSLKRQADRLEVETIFRAPSPGEPAFWHWDEDLDADGHDDLYLPTDDGLAVFFGDGKGAFSRPVQVPLRGRREILESTDSWIETVRSYPRPEFVDMDGDGRLDVTWFDADGLSWRPQSAPRRFGPTKRFELSWLSGQGSSNVLEQTDVSLDDINGDGRADLMLGRMRTEEGRITNMKTQIVGLLNRGGDEPFGRRPDLALQIPGVAGIGPTVEDVDGDGRPDLVLGMYAGGLLQAIGRLFSRIPVTVHVYRGTAGDAPFATTPALTRRINVPQDDFNRWGARRNISITDDLTGDGIADLFTMSTRRDRRWVEVSVGSRGADGLSIAESILVRTDLEDVQSVSFRTLTDDDTASVVIVQNTRGLTILDYRRLR